jgi:phosphatidate phosphatase APP1
MARMVLLANARTRLPLAGVAAFYRALQGGANGMSPAPFFYVSSSPWNLYDLFVHFMEIHDIPAGPLLLRDLGLSQGVLIQSSHAAHKRDQIDRLLQHYPDLNFILIGDSGQRDPEIYRQVVIDFPGRIRAIYIRDTSVAKRSEVVETMAHELSRQGVDMLLIQNTVAAAEHAAAHGLIDAATLPAIRDAHTREANSTNRTV